tara:strand:+ start:310 stop:1017 length:708 start_codon:yes stop_codon:yes gene_type:complete
MDSVSDWNLESSEDEDYNIQKQPNIQGMKEITQEKLYKQMRDNEITKYLNIDSNNIENHTILLESNKDHNLQESLIQVTSHDLNINNIISFKIDRVNYLLPSAMHYDMIIEELPYISCIKNIKNEALVSRLSGSITEGENIDTGEKSYIYHPEINLKNHPMHINFSKLKISLKPHGITHNLFKDLNDQLIEIYPTNKFLKEYYINSNESASEESYDHTHHIWLQIQIKTNKQNGI